MASTRERTTADGRRFYEIRVSRGRGSSYVTTRWYVPDGWSKKAIERELAKVSADFERRCKSGEFTSLKERKAAEARAAAERAAEETRILTLKQYCEKILMPGKMAGVIGKKAIAESTRAFYMNALKKHVYPALGDHRLTDITRADLEALLLEKQNAGYSASTINSIYVPLCQLFAEAEDTGMIPDDPMRKVKKPRRPKSEVRADNDLPTFTVEEMQYILSCLEHEPLKWRALVMLLVDTGCRRGEVCGLRWKAIDFKAGTITLDTNLLYTPEKSGGKGVYTDAPKTPKSIRTIDVSPEVMNLLKQLRLEQAASALSTYVFTQRGSTDPMHPSSPTRYFKQFARRYGIEDFHPHKLRHTFASIAITNGADIASVSEKLGHANKAITLKMYTHADQESIRRAGNIFRDALKKKSSDEVKQA